jgi:RNA polymerase sigma-70 factor (ECF subfamily)
MTMHDETTITRAIEQGDVRAMKWIFDDYHRMLSLFALRYVTSVDDARDLVQEVLIAFWEKKQGTTFTGSLKAYLFGAVQKAAVTFMKNTRRQLFTDIEEGGDLPTDIPGAFEEEEVRRRRDLMEREIERLPEKCKEVFTAIVLKNMQYKEVARELGVSVNTVKTHYTRALRQLRTKLEHLIFLLFFRRRRGS